MRFAALPCEILVWSLLRLFWLTPDVALTIQVRVMAFPEDNELETYYINIINELYKIDF